MKKDELADALYDALGPFFISDEASDANGNSANMVDVIDRLAENAHKIAVAICPPTIGTDAADGHVESLTEAAMGITAGLVKIAQAIGDLAEAIKEARA